MSRLLTPYVLIAGVAIAVGIYVQHRWPLGRLFERSTPPPVHAPHSTADIALLPAAQRLIIVAAGQSNAGNHGSVRANAGAKVYAFADGQLFAADDPLPGASGNGGSIWTRLGARLIHRGKYEAVVFAAIAQGSTRVEDWAAGGSHHRRLIDTLQQLKQAGIPPDFILWQQGETEAWGSSSSGQQYATGLREIIEKCRELCPNARFLVAGSTFGNGIPINEQIRLAQASAAQLGASAGPNFDQLGTEYRHDGIHFNEQGLSAAAELWLLALQPHLASQAQAPNAP